MHWSQVETAPFHGEGSVDGNDGWKEKEGQTQQELLRMDEECHRQDADD